MKFECYHKWSQLPASVDVLFNHCSNESLFFTREWFETLYKTTFDGNQSLLFISVVDDENVLALLLLVGEDENRESFCHRYTSLYSPLFLDERRYDTLRCLANGISQMPIHSLSLSPVDGNSDSIQDLRRSLETVGYEYHQSFFFYNWIHRTSQQSFDDYMAERPSQLRNTINRKRRKLEREQNYEIRLFKGTEVHSGLTDYHSAYSASWKANEQYVELLDAVAINLSLPDWTRLAILYIDGQAAAAQIWFVVKGKASIFRLAYDNNWKHYSPGSILTAYLMHYVIDIDKVEEIDFLTGNDAYKQDWMSERRERHRVMFVKQRKLQHSSDTFMLKLKKSVNAVFKKQTN